MRNVHVKCGSCGTPGVVVFNDNDLVEKTFFVCKCSRPTIDEVNKVIMLLQDERSKDDRRTS